MASQESVQGQSNAKVPVCTQHRLPMRQFTVKKEGPNKGKLFWNCAQSGDFCQSFLWHHDIDGKPNSWKLEFLVDTENGVQSKPAVSASYKLSLELVNRTHIEAKFLPALHDKDLAAAIAKFAIGNSNPSAYWRIPANRYQEFIDTLKPMLCKYNVEILYIPELILKRYVKGSVIPKLHTFDKNRISNEIWKKLLPFQREGIEQIVTKFNGRCIIADEMGLGKTVQAIGLLSYYQSDLPALIVVPASLRFHWKDTLLNWLPNLDENRIHVISSGYDWPRNEDSVDFMIISYALLSKFQSNIQEWNPGITFLDESHFIKTVNTKRSLAAAPIIKESRRAILLSGTPTTSRPIELFSQVDALHPGMLGTYKLFGVRYCNGREGQHGWECRGAQFLRELNLILTDTVMIRRLKKDVMADLPPKFRSGITVSSLPKAAAAEFKLKLNSIKDLESGSNQTNGLLATLYHDTGVAKIKDAANFIITKLESSESEKFLVFAHHQDVLDGIQAELQKEARSNSVIARIDGNTNLASRAQIVDRFQTDPKNRVLILSIKAASYGLTLTAGSNVLFAELAWNPQDLLQAEDRAHRIGQEKSHVNISYLLAKGTLDDMMWPTIQRKLSVCNATIDAGRGTSINVSFHHDRPEPSQPVTGKRQRKAAPKITSGPMDQYVSSSSRGKADNQQSSQSDQLDVIDLT